MVPQKDLVLGNYRLVEKLGEGGMGVVWKARDLKLDRDVAVKFLPEGAVDDPERRAFFEREAKAVAALSHPNIVTIYAVDEAEGATLLHHGARRRPDPRRSSIERRRRCRSTASSRSPCRWPRPWPPPTPAGIIHRDLKPAEHHDRRDGHASRSSTSAWPASSRRSAGRSSRDDGSTAHARRRLRRDHRLHVARSSSRSHPIDHRTDLFSLGVVLFEMGDRAGCPSGAQTGPETIAGGPQGGAPLGGRPQSPPAPLARPRPARTASRRSRRYRMASARDLRDELETLRQAGREGRDTGIPLDRRPALRRHEPGEGPGLLLRRHRRGDHQRPVPRPRPAGRLAHRLVPVQGHGGRPARDRPTSSRVETVLEGSVRKSDHRLRITVQLIDAARGFHLWSESYDRGARATSSRIQQEIAHNVVRALRVTLTPREKGRSGRDPDEPGPGLRLLPARAGASTTATAVTTSSSPCSSSRGPSSSIPATPWPTPGWPTAGPTSTSTRSARTPSAEQAEAAGRRAVELAPESAQAQASLGRGPVARPPQGRGQGGLRAGHRARPDPLRGLVLLRPPGLRRRRHAQGRLALRGGDAGPARGLQRAAAGRPGLPGAAAAPEDARAARERGVVLVERHIDLHPDDARALYMGANGLVALGEKDEGLEWARRARKIDPDDPMLLYNLGCIHSLAGDVDEAVDCLERAAAGGLLQKGWYENDSDLDPLRGHPRFKALLERM
ncbi:MAG: protein kinase [Candidatus Moduliflexus flocculans]|nr:protein kinase [Candidatus Moduliflexus flocculans]